MRDYRAMRIVARIVGFLIGGALAVIGFFFWMLSNDGIGGEASMKAIGAAGMFFGSVLCLAALLWRSPGNETRELDL